MKYVIKCNTVYDGKVRIYLFLSRQVDFETSRQSMNKS